MKECIHNVMQNWRYPVSVGHNCNKRVADPNHCHNFFQIFNANSGSCAHHAGELSTTLSPNIVSIIPESYPHSTDARHSDVDLYFLNLSKRMFSDSPDNPWSFRRTCLNPLSESVRSKTPVICLDAESAEKLRSLFTELNTMLTNYTPNDHLMIKGKTVELLSLVAAEYSSIEGMLHTTGVEGYCPSLYTAMSYIHSHFCDQDMSAEDVAHEAMLSDRSFNRIFRGAMDVSCAHYVQYLRIMYAKKLLAETDRILPDLMTDAGFSNLASFHRCFRNATGFTPREWRMHTQKELCIFPQRLVV